MRNFFLGVLLLFINFSLQAQETIEVVDYSKPREYEIADIEVKGVKYLSPQLLVNISGLKVGSKVTIPGDAITSAIEKFWMQKLFSDVQVSIAKTEGNKVWIEIFLKEHERLSYYTIDGIKKSEKQDLDEKLSIRRGGQLSSNVLNEIEYTIKEHYREKGFLNCDVQFEQVVDTTKENRVILNINIDKNSKVKIQEIEVIGNEVYTDNRVRRALKKTKQRDLNIFKGSKLIEEDYKEDKKKLSELYNKNGYRDFKLISDSLININDKRVKLILKLEEGNKYYFGDIEWVGNTKFESEILDRVLGIKKGDVYNQTLLDERLTIDEDAVTSLYMDDGYLFFSVNAIEKNIETDTIDFQMQIYEGQQATINEVIIRGNTKTNEHVVRRELRTLPGDLFSKTLLIRSVRELAALGHFNPETINPTPIPNQADGTVDIDYQLQERSNDQLELSAGYGGYGAVGTIGLRFSNFSIRNTFVKESWSPLPSGDGQTLSLRAQLNGRGYRSYNLSFVEPWFGGKKPNSFSFSVFYNLMDRAEQYKQMNEKYNANYYDTENASKFKALGTSIGLGQRLKWPDDFFTLYNELSYQRYDLKNYVYINVPDGIVNNFNIKTSFGRNSQDQMIYPRRGSSFSLTAQLTPPYSLFKGTGFWKLSDAEAEGLNESEVLEEELSKKYKWLEYHKWTFKSAWYTSIAGNLVLATKAEYGALAMFDRSVGYSPFEKFDLGGSGLTGYNITGTDVVAMRGYEDGALTPRDNQNFDAGNIYTKYSFELRYPVTLNPNATVFALTFFEAGNAWADFESFNPFVVKRSAGIGVRAFLPMFGLLGVDWGYGFDPSNIYPGQISGPQWHFVMGQQF